MAFDLKLFISVIWSFLIYLRQVNLLRIPYLMFLCLFPWNKHKFAKERLLLEKASWNESEAGAATVNKASDGFLDFVRWGIFKEVKCFKSCIWNEVLYEVKFELMGKKYHSFLNKTQCFCVSEIIYFMSQGYIPVKEKIQLIPGFNIIKTYDVDGIYSECLNCSAFLKNDLSEKTLVDYSYEKKISINILGPLSTLSVFLSSRDSFPSWVIWFGVILPIFIDSTLRIWVLIFDYLKFQLNWILKTKVFKTLNQNKLRSILSLVFKSLKSCDTFAGKSYEIKSKYVVIQKTSGINFENLKIRNVLNIYDLNLNPKESFSRQRFFGKMNFTVENGFFKMSGDGIPLNQNMVGLLNHDPRISISFCEWMDLNGLVVLRGLKENMVGHVENHHMGYWSGEYFDPIIVELEDEISYLIDDYMELDYLQSVYFNSLPYDLRIKSILFHHNKEFFGELNLEKMNSVISKFSLFKKPKIFKSSEWKRYSSDVSIILSAAKSFFKNQYKKNNSSCLNKVLTEELEIKLDTRTISYGMRNTLISKTIETVETKKIFEKCIKINNINNLLNPKNNEEKESEGRKKNVKPKKASRTAQRIEFSPNIQKNLEVEKENVKEEVNKFFMRFNQPNTKKVKNLINEKPLNIILPKITLAGESIDKSVKRIIDRSNLNIKEMGKKLEITKEIDDINQIEDSIKDKEKELENLEEIIDKFDFEIGDRNIYLGLNRSDINKAILYCPFETINRLDSLDFNFQLNECSYFYLPYYTEIKSREIANWEKYDFFSKYKNYAKRKNHQITICNNNRLAEDCMFKYANSWEKSREVWFKLAVEGKGFLDKVFKFKEDDTLNLDYFKNVFHFEITEEQKVIREKYKEAHKKIQNELDQLKNNLKEAEKVKCKKENKFESVRKTIKKAKAINEDIISLENRFSCLIDESGENNNNEGFLKKIKCGEVKDNYILGYNILGLRKTFDNNFKDKENEIIKKSKKSFKKNRYENKMRAETKRNKKLNCLYEASGEKTKERIKESFKEINTLPDNLNEDGMSLKNEIKNKIYNLNEIFGKNIMVTRKLRLNYKNLGEIESIYKKIKKEEEKINLIGMEGKNYIKDKIKDINLKGKVKSNISILLLPEI